MFSFDDVIPGNYYLAASFIGYQEIKTPDFNINKKGGNSIYATAYFRYVDNVINFVNTLAYEANGVVIDRIINRVYSNVGKSKAIVLEVGATKKPTKNWSNSIGENGYNYVIDGVLNFKH